jgi:hypothetical protein
MSAQVPSVHASPLFLVPLRLLPTSAQWRALATTLPPNALVLCLPEANTPERLATWQAIALSAQTRGWPIRRYTVSDLERVLDDLPRV